MILGIEIGGTKLQLGVGRGDGTPPVELLRRDIVIANGAPGILEQIRAAGSELVSRHPVRAVGIGFGGPVNPHTRCVITSHQVHGWDDFPLAEWCEQLWGVPTRVGNDCDCAALAEALDGAGQGRHCVFYVTVGTGIGGGLVIGGRLHGEGRPAVAEVGHLRPGPACDRSTQTVESLASGPGLANAAIERLRAILASPPKTAEQSRRHEQAQVLTRQGVDRVTAKTLAEHADAGNALAAELLEDGIRVLGWAIAQAITLIAPQVIVVGGGVSLMGEKRFYAPLRREVERYVFPPLRQSYEIVSPAFGETVVVLGAIRLHSTPS